jgi:hypothetical protein
LAYGVFLFLIQAADQPETEVHREKPEQTNAADGQSPGNKEKPGKNESLVKIEDAAKRSQGIGSDISPVPENETQPKT